MSRPRPRLSSLLSGHLDAPYDPERREFIEGVATALYDRCGDFDRWPKSVRFFYACYDLNYQVGNGGFAQAVYNVPELIPVAREAFEEFGRMEAADLCGRVLAMMPDELAEHEAKGFTGSESLEEVFDHFKESALAELDEEVPDEFWVDDELQRLVERNREDFESIDNLA